MSSELPQEESEWRLIEGPSSEQFTTQASIAFAGICSYTQEATEAMGCFRV